PLNSQFTPNFTTFIGSLELIDVVAGPARVVLSVKISLRLPKPMKLYSALSVRLSVTAYSMPPPAMTASRSKEFEPEIAPKAGSEPAKLKFSWVQAPPLFAKNSVRSSGTPTRMATVLRMVSLYVMEIAPVGGTPRNASLEIADI